MVRIVGGGGGGGGGGELSPPPPPPRPPPLPPPAPKNTGEPSYPQWKQEYDTAFDALARKAAKWAHGLGQLPGMSCTLSAGAMYTFPRITPGSRVIQAYSHQPCL